MANTVVPCAFQTYSFGMGKFLLIDKPAIVYLVTNPINGKRYIGATTKTLDERRTAHRYVAKQGTNRGAFHNAIRKYGVDALEWSVLSNHPTAADAASEEARLIRETRPEYNSTPGGLGFQARAWSEEAKRQMSQKKKGVPTGRHVPMPAHVKEALRKANEGRPSHWKGKNLPPHMCALISERMKMRADKDRILSLGPKSMQRRTVCLNDGMEYESASAAAAAYGVDRSQLIKVCNKRGPRKSVAGLVFRWFGEHEGGVAEADAVIEAVRKGNSDRSKLARSLIKKTDLGKLVRCENDGLIFHSILAAAAHYGKHPATISAGCKGKVRGRNKKQLWFSFVDEGCSQ